MGLVPSLLFTEIEGSQLQLPNRARSPSEASPEFHAAASLSATTQKAADHWATQYKDNTVARREWIGHPLAKERQNRLLGNRIPENWLIKTQLPNVPVARALEIGVGAADCEVHLLHLGAARHFDLYDVSEAGLEMARDTAKRLGVADRITLHCRDINTVQLPESAHGLITFMASLHHIDELEKTLRSCDRALAPGGVLWANEYVGPDRFDYPDRDADIVRRIYRALRPELHLGGEPELRFPTPAEVVAVDPTEAIHSSEILPTMRRIWPSLKVTGQYGSLLFMIMWCLDYNAIYDTEQGREAYGLLIELETALVDAGVLPHYFVDAIARRPSVRQDFAKRLGVDPQGPVYQSLQQTAAALRRHFPMLSRL
jgi:SAM-dependent methyltransferase